jgi:hypothetical protein
VRTALASQKALVSVNYSIQPAAVCLGRLALVGDAAGCCHPLTATGLTASTRDAIHLQQALRERLVAPARYPSGGRETFRRPCGATRRFARGRSARGWRSPSPSTGRSASRHPRCGSCETGSSGSGSGAVGAVRRPWLSCRPTRAGCR